MRSDVLLFARPVSARSTVLNIPYLPLLASCHGLGGSAVFSDNLSGPLPSMAACSLERVRLAAFVKTISCCGNFSSASSAPSSSARADDNSNLAWPVWLTGKGGVFALQSPEVLVPEIFCRPASCPLLNLLLSLPVAQLYQTWRLGITTTPFYLAEGCIIAETRAAVSSGKRSPDISSCTPFLFLRPCPVHQTALPLSVHPDSAFSIIKCPQTCQHRQMPRLLRCQVL